MALPTIKVAVSNGHFQESLQNWGDRGTWTGVGSYSAPSTVLTDDNANWVVDEWIGYYVVVDTNESNPTVAAITDNTVNTLTVTGNHSSLTAGTDTYRIAGGVVGTVTANGTASTSIALTAIKNKYGTNVNPEEHEFKGMYFVPDKLDGTAYLISANTTTGSNTTTLTIDTSIAVSATSFEIGRGASATLYPESIDIDGELNEPKQLTATVLNDIEGANKYSDDDSISNALQLGSTVRVTETTGSKVIFDGHIIDAPTQVHSDSREITFTAMDKSASLDYTIIPGNKMSTAGVLPSFNWTKSTELIETGNAGYGSDNKIFQTKAYQDYTYVAQPFALPNSTTNTDGTYTTLAITNTVTNSDVMQYSTGGFTSDIIKPGCVVLNCTQNKATYVEVVDSNTQITTIDAIWNTNDRFVIFSCNWQIGEGVESDADYVAGGSNDGYGFNTVLREALTAPATRTESDNDSNRIYVGRTSGSDRDDRIGFNGRGWVAILKGATNNFIELAHYHGNLPDHDKDKWYLSAFSDGAEEDRHTRGDLTNSWDTDDNDEYGIAWAADTYVIECFPNRFGGSPPLVYNVDKTSPMSADEGDYAVTASEGLIHFSQGDNRWDGKTSIYSHMYTYDADASSANPDKGTDTTSLDISEIVQIATTGLTSLTASNEDIIKSSKETGGAGLIYDTTNSQNTGVKINNIQYKAFEGGKIPLEPKSLIDKVCEDAGLLYDLRYDDNSEKMVFKPLTQKSSADITFAAGSLVSLSRERDLSDVYSAVLLQIQLPDQNYFAPKNILQYGCNYSTASVAKSDAPQTGFSKDYGGTWNSTSDGATPPLYFWDSTFLGGLGPDVQKFDVNTEAFRGKSTYLHQALWRRMEWRTDGGTGDDSYQWVKKSSMGIPTTNALNDPLHLCTFWFRDGISLDLDEFSFTSELAADRGLKWNGGRWRVQVTTELNASDPLSASTTWQNFNDNAVELRASNGGKRFKLKDCAVKGVNGIRILALGSPAAQPGWAGERRCWLRQTNAAKGYKTYGFDLEVDGSSRGDNAAEAFQRPNVFTNHGRGHALGNKLRQDSWFFSVDPNTHNNTYRYTAFDNAIDATTNDAGHRAGYVYCGNTLSNFEVTGVGKKAMFIRSTKNQITKDDPERLSYSPTYKKIASLGYKTMPVNLGNFSKTEGQSLGQQHIDDKLRRFQARDYSLEGKSPFVDSNNLPALGKTITVSDDSFTGVLTSYKFSLTADGSRFDFRLEDYDRNKTAKLIQAK